MNGKLQKQVIDRIKAILKEKKWKPADLARETGFSKGYISLALSGQKNMTLESIERLENALKTPIIKV